MKNRYPVEIIYGKNIDNPSNLLTLNQYYSDKLQVFLTIVIKEQEKVIDRKSYPQPLPNNIEDIINELETFYSHKGRGYKIEIKQIRKRKID